MARCPSTIQEQLEQLTNTIQEQKETIDGDQYLYTVGGRIGLDELEARMISLREHQEKDMQAAVQWMLQQYTIDGYDVPDFSIPTL